MDAENCGAELLRKVWSATLKGEDLVPWQLPRGTRSHSSASAWHSSRGGGGSGCSGGAGSSGLGLGGAGVVRGRGSSARARVSGLGLRTAGAGAMPGSWISGSAHGSPSPSKLDLRA